MIVHQSLFGQSSPQALTENPIGVPSFSPGLAVLRPTPGIDHHKNKTQCRRPRAALQSERVSIFAALTPLPGSFLPHFAHPQTNPLPKSTLAHPKSTVDLGCEELIRVDNGLNSSPSPTRYRLKSGPKIKKFNQTQTVTGRKILPLVVSHGGRPQGPILCLILYPTQLHATLGNPTQHPPTPAFLFAIGGLRVGTVRMVAVRKDLT
jgi:hypothetical protein